MSTWMNTWTGLLLAGALCFALKLAGYLAPQTGWSGRGWCASPG